MDAPQPSPHLVFDWDLTLFNPWPLNIRTMNRLREKRNFQPLTYEHYRETYGYGHAMHDVLGDMLGAKNETEEAALYKEFQDAYLQVLKTDPDVFEMMPGAIELIKDLAASGYMLAINSNKPERLLRAEIERAGLTDYFTVIISGETLKDKHGELVLKPDPRVLHHIAKELTNTRAENIPLVVIGDSATDLKSAEAYKNALAYLLHSDPKGPDMKGLHIDAAFNSIRGLRLALLGG